MHRSATLILLIALVFACTATLATPPTTDSLGLRILRRERERNSKRNNRSDIALSANADAAALLTAAADAPLCPPASAEKLLSTGKTSLSDYDFFTNVVDTAAFPALQQIPLLVQQQNFTAAKRVFAKHIRSSLKPGLLMKSWITFYAAKRSKETVPHALDRILKGQLLASGVTYDFKNVCGVSYSRVPKSGYSEFAWGLNRHVDWGLLAQQYRKTKDERYAEAFAFMLRAFIAQAPDAPEGIDLKGPPYYTMRTLEVGMRMARSWPWALFLFKDSMHFDDALLVEMYKSIYQQADRLRRFHSSKSNWKLIEFNGLATAAVLYPELKASSEWSEYVGEQMYKALRTQVYADGFHYELSTSYHQLVIRQFQEVLEKWSAFGRQMPRAEKFRQAIEDMNSVNLQLLRPDHCLPNINDGTWANVKQYMLRASQVYPERQDFRWAATEGVEGMQPNFTSTALPNSGLSVLRSGWSETSLYLLFDQGPLGAGHYHEDKLNLLVHAYGRLLLTEAGSYAYDESPMYYYSKSTLGHNTVRVNGASQQRNKLHQNNTEKNHLSMPARGMRFFTSDAVDVSEGSYGDMAHIEERYGDDTTQPGELVHTRRVVFMKQPNAFLPADRIQRETVSEGGEPSVLLTRQDGRGLLSVGPFYIVIDQLWPNSTYIQQRETQRAMSELPAESKQLLLQASPNAALQWLTSAGSSAAADTSLTAQEQEHLSSLQASIAKLQTAIDSHTTASAAASRLSLSRLRKEAAVLEQKQAAYTAAQQVAAAAGANMTSLEAVKQQVQDAVAAKLTDAMTYEYETLWHLNANSAVMLSDFLMQIAAEENKRLGPQLRAQADGMADTFRVPSFADSTAANSKGAEDSKDTHAASEMCAALCSKMSGPSCSVLCASLASALDGEQLRAAAKGLASNQKSIPATSSWQRLYGTRTFAHTVRQRIEAFRAPRLTNLRGGLEDESEGDAPDVLRVELSFEVEVPRDKKKTDKNAKLAASANGTPATLLQSARRFGEGVSRGGLLGVVSRDEGQANLAVVGGVDSALGGVSVEIVEAQKAPEWQGWRATQQNQGAYISIPTAKFTWRAAGTSHLVTILYPMPPGSNECPIVGARLVPPAGGEGVGAAGKPSLDGWGVELSLRDGSKVTIPGSAIAIPEPAALE